MSFHKAETPDEQSINEFFDGIPSFDAKNFSRYKLNTGQHKRFPAYISTNEGPPGQDIVVSNPPTDYLIELVKNEYIKKAQLKKDQQSS